MLDARLLLCEVLGAKQEYLMSYPEKVLTVEETAAFQDLVTERANGKPIAYLLGRQHFYDIEVCVTPDVLIPRPETELLVEKAIRWAGNRAITVVDVGTGSGVIALTLAKHLPNATIIGVDLSSAALDVARCNAEYLGLKDRVRWLQGNLLEPLVASGEQADLITANLPYIPTEELKTLEVSKHEPILALDGGADGLAVIRPFLADAPKVLRPNGLLLMETAADQGDRISELVKQVFPAKSVTIERDLAGHQRMVIAE